MLESWNSKKIKTQDLVEALVEDLAKLLLLAADLGLGANFKPTKKSKVDSETAAQFNILSNFLLGKLSSLKTISSYDEMEKKIKEIGSEFKKSKPCQKTARDIYLSALTAYYREYLIKSPVISDEDIIKAFSDISKNADKYIKDMRFKVFSLPAPKVEKIVAEEPRSLAESNNSISNENKQEEQKKQNEAIEEVAQPKNIRMYAGKGFIDCDAIKATIGPKLEDIEKIEKKLDGLISQFKNKDSTKIKLDIYIEILELQSSLAYFNSDYDEVIDARQEVYNKIQKFESDCVEKLCPKLTKIYNDKILTPVMEYSSYLENKLESYNAEAKDDKKLKLKHSVMKTAQTYLLYKTDPTIQELALSIVNTSRYIESNKKILLEERDGAVIAFLKKLFGISQEDVVLEENKKDINTVKWGTTTAQSKLLKPMGLFVPPKEPKEKESLNEHVEQVIYLNA